MEEFVTAVLFIYPGAIIELMYRRYAKYGYKEDNHAEPIKLTELFLCSIIVTILSVMMLRVFGGIDVDSLNGLVFELNQFGTLAKYLILSFLLTCIVAWIRYEVSGMDPYHEDSADQKPINGCRVVGAANAWRDLIYGPDLQDILGHCIVRITHGEMMTAGFVMCFPTDFEKGISLSQTAFVEARLEEEKKWKPEQRNIGDPYAVYFDAPTGVKVEFFDGKDLFDYLKA